MRRSSIRVIGGLIALNVILFTVSLLFAQAGNWQTVNTNNLPTARHETSFVHVGGKFYLIGGRESKVVQIYNPATNQWTNGATAPKVMHHIQPVVVDNLIYAVAAYSGTCCDDEFGLSNSYIYDPAADKWITGGLIPEARRRGGGGVVYYQGKFYIVGGLTGGHGMGNDGVSANSRNWFDSWNPYTNTWQILTNAPRDRDHFGAAVVGSKLYASSGRASEGASFFGQTIAQVDVYNFITGQWSTLPAGANIPTQRAGTAVVTLGNEVIVIGGESGNQNTAHNKTEALNTANNTWRTLDTLNQGRHGTTATICNGLIYIAAGSPVRGGGKLSSMERYYETVASSCPATTITPGQISSNNNGNFGKVKVGQSLTKTITITHSSGNQGLIITGFSKTGSGDFTATFPHTLPIVLAPGMSVNISVKYTPSGTGTDTGTLAITRHNSNQALQVALSGEGTNGSSSTDTQTPTSTSTDIPASTATASATETENPAATASPTEANPLETSTATPINETPSPTFTAIIETLVPTLTLTPTDDPTTLTPTATTPAGLELVVNGDFEAKTADQAPDLAPWVLKNGLKDKVKCAKEGKPPIAHTGECAFRFKGGIAENAKIQQTVEVANFAFSEANLLNLHVYLKTTGDQVAGKIKVVVAYTDTTLGKSKISVALAPADDYAEIVGSVGLLSGDLAKLKIQVSHKSLAGKVLVDGISLQLTANALIALPG
ncbi:MAG: choice-of-anchor D domain-containing protein [Anaerolineae bacterium]|nr:choice-of-anchor D domain-containing protein [Anaerolineae bacterium]